MAWATSKFCVQIHVAEAGSVISFYCNTEVILFQVLYPPPKSKLQTMFCSTLQLGQIFQILKIKCKCLSLTPNNILTGKSSSHANNIMVKMRN
jgi:hypothetical protein